MPTGVAVSPAMNHGGPFPATGHPGFTAVGHSGIACGVSPRCSATTTCANSRLPPALRNQNPNGRMWRLIDGRWTQSDVGA